MRVFLSGISPRLQQSFQALMHPIGITYTPSSLLEPYSVTFKTIKNEDDSIAFCIDLTL